MQKIILSHPHKKIPSLQTYTHTFNHISTHSTPAFLHLNSLTYTPRNTNIPKHTPKHKRIHVTKRDLPGAKAAGQGTATLAGHG